VRYFCRHLRPFRARLLDHLRAVELDPQFDSDDSELRAAWLASNAVVWASLRDFVRAHDSITRAHAAKARDSWVLTCESDALGLEDRWEDARRAAEEAWEIDPGAPYAARSLGASLLNLRRVDEAACRLVAATENSESYEVAHVACWYQCALAETLAGDERQQALSTARLLVDRLPDLAPLADRESRSLFARTRLDLAELADDHDQIELWAKQVRAPFYRQVLENMRKNPAGRRIRLPFRRAIQKHEACLPTSLASALAPAGVLIDPDEMAKEVTFGGTAEWAAAEWLEHQGLTVRFFAVTPDVATRLIRHGFAFVLTLEADESAHAVAVVGLDESAGTLLVHDPLAFRTAEYLLHGFGQKQEPLGFKGMVAAPQDKSGLLDELLRDADVEVLTAAVRHQKALQLHGPRAGREIVAELARKLPAHPGTHLLEAMQVTEDGRIGEALFGFQELLKQFPKSVFVRARLLSVCRAVGNTALLREILAGVVERGMLPGIESQQDWLYPPPRYLCDYADVLRQSAVTDSQAQSLLHSVIRRQPNFADSWHILADILWRTRDIAGALLSYRIASCLAHNNEHYARAYCDALALNRRETEGLAWLEARVRAFGASSQAAGSWISWINALENWGHPDRGLAACSEALQVHPGSADLLAAAIPFLARMGHWDEAQRLLDHLQTLANPSLFHKAAVDFYRMHGDLAASINHAHQWIEEAPRHTGARSVFLDLTAKWSGPNKSVAQAAQWAAEQPGHDEWEELYYRELERAAAARWKRVLRLRRRLKRNPQDGWAWRELALCQMLEYDHAGDRRRARLDPRILAALAECQRTAPHDPGTTRVLAQWHEVRGEYARAVELWLDSIDRDPANFYSYQHVWECSCGLPAQQRQAVWDKMEPILLRNPGHLSIAGSTLMLVAQRFGPTIAEQTAQRWQQARPEDPDVIEAAADLLLLHGHGRSDAARAMVMLKPAVERFPYHLGLRFSLIDAFRKLNQFADAEQALCEIIQRHPDNSSARIQLAWVHESRGQLDEACRHLKSASARDPQNSQIWDALAQILLRNHRSREARDLVQRTLDRLPEDVQWRNRAIRLLFECVDEEGAVAAAREGVRIHPQGAYLWLLLGTTLDQVKRCAQAGEIEACFRRSFSLNESFFDAADHLAMLLVDQRRHDEAAAVMEAIRPRLRDPCPAVGRIAWIHREQGRKSGAREELAELLRSAPWYRWGWAVLMEWLAQDAAWEQARDLLGNIVAELRTDTQFRRQRLQLLEKASLPASELDAEWNELLRDFPEDVPLHLFRFDSLDEAERFLEAAVVLDRIRSVEATNPYTLARSVGVRAREGKTDEVLLDLAYVFFADTGSSSWPADHAWAAIKKARMQEAAYQEARRLLAEGRQPTPHALSILGSYAMQRSQTTTPTRQPRWRVWWPDPGAREVEALLALVDRAPWPRGGSRATLLSKLSDTGYQRRVLRYWEKRRAEVEADVQTWAETARALVGLNLKGRARALLAGWRTRPGVGMWVVANYVGCFSPLRRSHLQEVVSSCRDALAGLPHDHCSRYLAHVQAEACALLGDTDAFLATWKENRGYFDCKESTSEYFQSQRRRLLTDVPMMARYLEQNELRLYRRMVRSLRWNYIAPTLGITGAGSAAIKLPWWTWLLLIWLLLEVLARKM
jgi:tetratricopeptide (TPR) repeat protein